MTILGYAKYSLLTLCFVACATGTKKTGFDYSIAAVKNAVEKHLPGSIQSMSSNGRVYTTTAFRLPLYYQTKEHKRDEAAPERGKAKVLILGDKRPYTLQAEISVENLVVGQDGKKQYVYCCRQKAFEQDLLKSIHGELVKRKDNQDLIDDFRPF